MNAYLPLPFLIYRNKVAPAAFFYTPRLIPRAVRHSGNSVQQFVCSFLPFVAAVQQRTKMPSALDISALSEKVSRKYFW